MANKNDAENRNEKIISGIKEQGVDKRSVTCKFKNSAMLLKDS